MCEMFSQTVRQRRPHKNTSQTRNECINETIDQRPPTERFVILAPITRHPEGGGLQSHKKVGYA